MKSRQYYIMAISLGLSVLTVNANATIVFLAVAMLVYALGGDK